MSTRRMCKSCDKVYKEITCRLQTHVKSDFFYKCNFSFYISLAMLYIEALNGAWREKRTADCFRMLLTPDKII